MSDWHQIVRRDNGVYYAYLRYDGNRTLYKRSLKTKDRDEAYRRYYNPEERYRLNIKNTSKSIRKTIATCKEEFLKGVGNLLTNSKYRGAIKRFESFSNGDLKIKYIDEIDYIHIRDFINKRRKEVSESTVGGEVRSLSVFFSEALKCKDIREHPIKGKMKIPKIASRIEFYQPQEIELMLNKSKQDKFLYAVIMFLLQTGVRENGAIQALWENFNEEQRTLNTIWKGGWMKNVFLPNKTFKAIKSLHQENKYIFPNPDRDKSGVQRWAKLSKDIVGFLQSIGIKGNPQKFRHTYATYSMACGMPPTTLRDRMGHSSIATTDKYSKAINFKLDSKMRKIFGEWSNGYQNG